MQFLHFLILWFVILQSTSLNSLILFLFEVQANHFVFIQFSFPIRLFEATFHLIHRFIHHLFIVEADLIL